MANKLFFKIIYFSEMLFHSIIGISTIDKVEYSNIEIDKSTKLTKHLSAIVDNYMIKFLWGVKRVYG